MTKDSLTCQTVTINPYVHIPFSHQVLDVSKSK